MNKNFQILIKKILITLLLYLAYKALGLLSLVKSSENLELVKAFSSQQYSLITLSYYPLATGYLLVELLFLIIPPLRRIRNNGFEGRKIINTWALRTSVVYAVFLAILQVYYLGRMTSFDGSPLLANQSLLAMIYYVLFYLVGFALVIWIAKIISKYGIGNGFCILIGFPILFDILTKISSYFEYVKVNNINVNFIGFIILISLIIFIYKYIKDKEWKIEILNEKVPFVKIPYFLQGVGLISISITVIEIIKTYNVSFAEMYNSNWFTIIFTACLVIPVSLIGHWMFTNKDRIAANLNVDVNSVGRTSNAFIKSTAVLFLITLALSIPFPFETYKLIPITIFLVQLISLIAIVIDIKNQSEFHLKNKTYVEVCELDNVLYSSTIKNRLTDLQIDHFIQAYHYRQIFFFLDPLIKMKLMVAEENKETVKELLSSYNIRNI